MMLQKVNNSFLFLEKLKLKKVHYNKILVSVYFLYIGQKTSTIYYNMYPFKEKVSVKQEKKRDIVKL